MKKTLMICLLALSFNLPAKAQEQEAAQLLLNVEKLATLKNILESMYTGYTILTNGYNAVKDISEGNFSLHQNFLDGLMAVSPTVRKYQRVVDIISQQQTILSEYGRAYNAFVASGQFSPAEINYINRIYSQLFNRSLQNLQELTIIVTAGQVRMNDAERLKSIDRIYEDMTDKLTFLRGFNKQTATLQNLRIHDKENQEMLKTFYGL